MCSAPMQACCTALYAVVTVLGGWSCTAFWTGDECECLGQPVFGFLVYLWVHGLVVIGDSRRRGHAGMGVVGAAIGWGDQPVLCVLCLGYSAVCLLGGDSCCRLCVTKVRPFRGRKVRGRDSKCQLRAPASLPQPCGSIPLGSMAPCWCSPKKGEEASIL